MIKGWYIGMFCFCCLVSLIGGAQNENDSADVTNEQVEDEFQDHFFEALRERAIENYGKAIDNLMECKRLDPENAAVDFEIGINYQSMKNYEQAENYLLAAVEKDPENRWYSEILFDVYQTQNKNDEAVAVAEKLSETNDAYKKSLVYLYAQNNQYDKALSQLDVLDRLYGTSEDRERMRTRFKAYEKYQTNMENDITVLEAPEDNNTKETPAVTANPLADMEKEMDRLLKGQAYKELLEKTDEALESYPAQAYFYYMNGVAKQNMRNFKMAVEAYENALVYLIDDLALEKKIYAGLAACHKQLGNIQKEQEYLEKAKSI